MDDPNACAAEPTPEARPYETLCTLRELESRHIVRALDLAGGNQRRAARLLGITRWSLARRLRKFGLDGRALPGT